MQRQYLRAAPRCAKYSSKKSPRPCKTLSPFVVITTYRVVLPTPERRAGRQGSPPPAATSRRALRRRSARPGPAPFAERGASSPWRPPLPGPAAPLSSAPPIRPRRRCRSAPRKPRPADRYQVGFSPMYGIWVALDFSGSALLCTTASSRVRRPSGLPFTLPTAPLCAVTELWVSGNAEICLQQSGFWDQNLKC